MAHVAFHLSEEFISEDLDYYFSGERDKNNQIRPDDNIYSLTPDSAHLNYSLGDGQTGNFFYPRLPNLLDRIYIGISIPLFANNWGAAFLLQLLKILKPSGAIILPVYPEGQAQEKGYWSRSFLENIFLSRQRWTGFSNVTAENDGVMSLRVGRKWPDPIPSSIEWFYQQCVNIALEKSLETKSEDEIHIVFSDLVNKVWENYAHSAVIERIILDTCGAKTPLKLQTISDDYGLLTTELLLSPYINVQKCKTINISNKQTLISKNFKSFFSPHNEDRHNIIESDLLNVEIDEQVDVICLLNAFRDLEEADLKAFISKVWQSIKPSGLLVIYEDFKTNSHSFQPSKFQSVLEKLGEVRVYSSIVASEIQNLVDISHYSMIQEKRLREEKAKKESVYWVLQKSL